MDIFDDLQNYSEAGSLDALTQEGGKNLSALVRRLQKVEQTIADNEQYLKTLKQEKHSLSMETIPALMSEMGLERVDVDGMTVTRKMVVHASIPADRKEDAFNWLRSEGLDDIIKNDVVVSFGRGQDNAAGDAVGLLRDRGFDPETKTHIHPMTLKAFVKERVENGAPIDLDMFGAFVANVAEIRRK